jgi:tetratricopeptide (TPR) repeat protein
MKGEFDRAVRILEECCRLCRLGELRVWLAWAQSPLGDAYTLAGRLDEAVAHLEQAVEHAGFLKHSHAMRVVVLGQAYMRYGRLKAATDAAYQALALAREHQERGHEAWALRLLGEIESRADPPDRDAAKTHYLQALALADELSMRPLVARCYLGLGLLYREARDQGPAQRHLAAAMALFNDTGMQSWSALTEQLLNEPSSPVATADG